MFISFRIVKVCYYNSKNTSVDDCDIDYDYSTAFLKGVYQKDYNRRTYVLIDYNSGKMTSFDVNKRNNHIVFIDNVITEDITGSFQDGWSTSNHEYKVFDAVNDEFIEDGWLRLYLKDCEEVKSYLKYLKQ